MLHGHAACPALCTERGPVTDGFPRIHSGDPVEVIGKDEPLREVLAGEIEGVRAALRAGP